MHHGRSAYNAAAAADLRQNISEGGGVAMLASRRHCHGVCHLSGIIRPEIQHAEPRAVSKPDCASSFLAFLDDLSASARYLPDIPALTRVVISLTCLLCSSVQHTHPNSRMHSQQSSWHLVIEVQNAPLLAVCLLAK